MENHYIVESPVALLLTERFGAPYAVATSTFSEVAHHPTSLWVSVEKQTKTHENLTVAPYFSLVILHDKQAHIAKMFSVEADAQQPNGPVIRKNDDGFYWIEDMLAVSFCKVLETHTVEQHTLFIGDILSGVVNTANTYAAHLLLSSLEVTR